MTYSDSQGPSVFSIVSQEGHRSQPAGLLKEEGQGRHRAAMLHADTHWGGRMRACRGTVETGGPTFRRRRNLGSWVSCVREPTNLSPRSLCPPLAQAFSCRVGKLLYSGIFLLEGVFLEPGSAGRIRLPTFLKQTQRTQRRGQRSGEEGRGRVCSVLGPGGDVALPTHPWHLLVSREGTALLRPNIGCRQAGRG